MIKRWFIYCSLFVFSVSFLAPDMQGLQVFRIGNLVQHVEYHFGDDWTWTELKSCVWEHYTSQSLPPDERHDQLPFKTPTNCGCVVANLSDPPVKFELAEPNDSQEKVIFREFKSPLKQRAGNIWTPPQLS